MSNQDFLDFIKQEIDKRERADLKASLILIKGGRHDV